MGKGSSPRNCFSKQFQDNYDSIDWSAPSSEERDLVNDLPALYRWGTETESVSTIEGMIRQSCDIPLDEDQSCANE
jgi:hypothetical protein